jgi:hypothetical protein
MGVIVIGIPETQAALRNLGRRGLKAYRQAFRAEGEAIMLRSKKDFVPVDFGNLKSSGRVRDVSPLNASPRITLSFGGSSAPYAVIVHENPKARHTVGQWKYIEQPANEAAQGMDVRIARRVRAALERRG